MTEQLMSLSKIFSEQLFRIPDYQRGYSWTLKEVEDFWNDLLRLQEGKNHYVGVLTLEPVNSNTYETWLDDVWLIKSKRYVPYYVVDGQQRLTTSVLLIHSIIEIMGEHNIEKLNYTSQESIIRKFICESKDEYLSRTYLFSYENNNPSYEHLITKIFKHNLQNSLHIEDTIYTYNLSKAKNFFMNKLRIIQDKNVLESIYAKITQNFLFNIYVISSDIDVFVTFETMNNRGKALSHLELLKNRLIYLSTLFDSDDDVKNRLRRNINECWKDIYHFLGKNRERKLLDDDFLNSHFQMYFCDKLNEITKKYSFYHDYNINEVQQNYLLETYFIPNNITNNTVKIDTVFQYIESMKGSIRIWDYINNPLSSDFGDDIKEYLNKINYLTSNCHYSHYFISNIRIFLLACFDKVTDEDIILNLLKKLERYIFLLDFYPFEVTNDIDLNKIQFEEIILNLNKCQININQITDKIDKASTQLTTLTDSKKLINYYNRCGFYNNRWLRYFLCEYELKLMNESKNKTCKLNRDLLFNEPYISDSIEHIYPRNSHNTYWLSQFKNYTPDERRKFKNSLGNFVAISSTKNSKLANKSFPEKKFNKQNSLGYQYGSYAEIELATLYTDWSDDEILERGIKLVNFLSTRWNIKIGSSKKNDKKRFLGLDFIK